MGLNPNRRRLSITRMLPYDVPDIGGAVPSVSSWTSLALFDTRGLGDGALVWVESRRCYVRFGAGSTATLLDGVITTAIGGRWMRLDFADPTWGEQVTWYVDATNGSDDNTGATNVVPLRTFLEFQRRMGSAGVVRVYQPTTVNVQTSLAANDNIDCVVAGDWNEEISATVPSLTIQGTPTLGANQLVAASSDEVANAAPTITVAAAVWTPGTIIESIDGANPGATAVVVADLGAGQARTSPWMSTGLARVVPPLAGTNIAARTVPAVDRLAVFNTIQASNLSIIALRATGTVGGQRCFYRQCQFEGTTSPAITAAGSTLFYGCAMNNTGGMVLPVIHGPAPQFGMCGIIRNSGTILCGSRVILFNCVIQGAVLEASSINDSGADLSLQSVGIFGGAAGSTALKGRRGAKVKVTGTLYGPNPGGASIGTDIAEGAQMYIDAAVTPTLTGATELRLDGAATALPDLLPAAGAVLPNAANLTTWADWTGATFGRNVVSHKTGAVIANHA